MFGLPDYVRYIEEFVISRLVIWRFYSTHFYCKISRPRSKLFLVSTWYRPPQSSRDLFTVFERVIDKIDAENLELYLLGDLNCDLLPDSVNY